MAASKKTRLLERARATARRPVATRLTDNENQKQGYRIVPVSLYSKEADWLDEIAAHLKNAGNPKANRSMVVREAIYTLQEALNTKNPDEVLLHFIKRFRKAA